MERDRKWQLPRMLSRRHFSVSEHCSLVFSYCTYYGDQPFGLTTTRVRGPKQRQHVLFIYQLDDVDDLAVVYHLIPRRGWLGCLLPGSGVAAGLRQPRTTLAAHGEGTTAGHTPRLSAFGSPEMPLSDFFPPCWGNNQWGWRRPRSFMCVKTAGKDFRGGWGVGVRKGVSIPWLDVFCSRCVYCVSLNISQEPVSSNGVVPNTAKLTNKVVHMIPVWEARVCPKCLKTLTAPRQEQVV